MEKKIKVLTIVGSPNGKRSNTYSLAHDFLNDVECEGLILERDTIFLSDLNLQPCLGCWSCRRGGICPLFDDINHVKKLMVECDFLILASPVYSHQVTAQIKTLIDRLNSWSRIYPLLGTYGLSVITTGYDGQLETGDYLEKVLVTFGVSSFGNVIGTGSFTPGFFPGRTGERFRYQGLAGKVAQTVWNGREPPLSEWSRQTFQNLRKKISMMQVMHHVVHGKTETIPEPSILRIKLFKIIQKQKNLSDDQLKKISGLMAFELQWWADRGWLSAKCFGDLRKKKIPPDFNLSERLLGFNPNRD